MSINIFGSFIMVIAINIFIYYEIFTIEIYIYLVVDRSYISQTIFFLKPVVILLVYKLFLLLFRIIIIIIKEKENAPIEYNGNTVNFVTTTRCDQWRVFFHLNVLKRLLFIISHKAFNVYKWYHFIFKRYSTRVEIIYVKNLYNTKNITLRL